MTRPPLMLRLASAVAVLALVAPAVLSGQATPPPFNAPERSYKMPCAYCHSVHGGTTVTSGTAAIEALCMSCHNGTFTDPVTGRQAVLVATHENSRTGRGQWRISCLGCHSPHRNAMAADSDLVNPPNGYGNWMLIGDWVPEASSTDGLARIRRPFITDPSGNNGGTGRTRYADDVMDGYHCSNVADVDTAANSGAVRSNNVVTIKTTTSHRYTAGASVWIGGVANRSFSGGPFTILATPTAKSFTFAQTGANATSGGGVARTRINDRPACNADPAGPNDLTRTVVFYDNRYPGSPATNQWSQAQMNPPTAGQWYNGACNVCHTRTTHHRRDNSTNGAEGDHTHNVTRACHDCHVHDKGWIK